MHTQNPDTKKPAVSAAVQRQHLADIRAKIKQLAALPSPSRLQSDELAEWRLAEREHLAAMRASTAADSMREQAINGLDEPLDAEDAR